MKNLFLALTLTLLAACNSKGTVSYAHDPNLTCPAPQPVPENITVEFTRYGNDQVMQEFYKHYLAQQRQLAAAQNRQIQCPPAFWAANDVAAKFKQYPTGHPMREFFKAYVAQQRAIDAYYSPTTIR